MTPDFQKFLDERRMTVIERLCRTDNHVSGNSDGSNKYAIKRESVSKAIEDTARAAALKAVEMVRDYAEKRYGFADRNTDFAKGYCRALQDLVRRILQDVSQKVAYEQRHILWIMNLVHREKEELQTSLKELLDIRDCNCE